MIRICITTSDVALITGKTSRQARNIINDIKDHLGKAKHQVVTVKEFCHYMGIPEDDITKYIK